MVSIIIPARNEQYLEKTIQSVLEAAEGEIEVLVMLDGWDPKLDIKDPRVIFHLEPEAIGQRQQINKGARLAKGKYIMKLDAHCSIGKGFDVILARDCQHDWTMIPSMYNLDVTTWTPRFFNDRRTAVGRGKLNEYMYIGWNDKNELRALYYNGTERHRQHNNDRKIDDTMCCMGPCFFMEKTRFWELEGCDEKHGGWGQQGIEVSCKAWLSGGALKVDKNTWFAHWFRGGGGPGFPYSLSGRSIDKAREYSKDLWLNNKWPLQTRKFQWLLDKFKPPSWEGRENMDALQSTFYHKVHLRGHDPRWRGVKVVKLPTDFLLYSEAIWDKKPDFIVEAGTAFGGSALFLADMLELNGKGKVLSIDIKVRGTMVPHPRIEYFLGSSTSNEIIDKIKSIVGDKSVMVVLDSDHSRVHVKWELKKYADIVTKGQYLVVEDCYGRQGELVGPGEARDWFLKVNHDFQLTDHGQRYLVGFTKGGWLLKK